MNCKDCVWWSMGDYDGYRYENLCFDRRSDLVPMPNPVRKFCLCPKRVFYERPALDGCAVVDGSEYMAELITGPMFGCVNFESRKLQCTS